MISIPRRSVRLMLFALFALSCVTVVFLAVTYLGWHLKDQRIQLLMLWSILVGVVLLWSQRRRFAHMPFAIAAILFAGLVMRFGYALYTPATLRFHDLAPIDVNATGHAGYVLHLYLYGALPTSNAFQYATPPLYYMLSAFFMRIYALGSGLSNTVELFEAARLPSLFASCGALLLAWQIGKELKLSRLGMIVLLTLCAFLPNHYLLAGRANPDGLAVFFVFLVTLYALRWHRTPSTGNTIMLALGFGFGMMTKMTVAVMALPVGIMMVIMIWRRCVRHGEWLFLKQIGLFALIAFPLGLWFPLRNAMLYGQPLGFVYDMGIDHPQFIGDVPLWQRFGLSSLRALVTPLYVDWQSSANALIYTLKSSVFGEFSYEIDPMIPYLLLLANTFLVLLSLAATGAVTWKALRERSGNWLLLCGIWLAILFSYLLFNLRYPFHCSMDYRYMVGTSLIGALMLAKAESMLGDGTLLRKVLVSSAGFALTAFAAASIAMYTHIV